MSIRDLPPSPPPHSYRARSPETWAKARDDYAAGVPAPEVCERYDLGVANLRKRAREEGWRRRDLDDPDPEPPVETGAPADPRLMAEQAWARAARAVERGRVLEATRWSRLAEELRAVAAAQEAERRRAGEEAARSASDAAEEPA